MRYYLFCFVILLSACKPTIKPADLYGTWKYIKVENPNETPPDSVSHDDLAQQSPYIKFTTTDSLIIIWGGKLLSHGKFTIEGNNIQYKEDMPGGKSRSFPFYISKIDSKNLVFETLGEEGTRVTAVR
jgi:hypothetical protein